MIYEHPINNKIRNWLRFSHSFHRLKGLVSAPYAEWDYLSFYQLFDILELTEQSDIRSELLMELDRFHQVLQMFAGNPEIERDEWEKLVGQINRASIDLRSSPNRPAHVLCANPWISTLRSRMHLAGGCNEYDVPSFHWWRAQSEDRKRADLNDFQKLFEPYYQALITLLDSIRATAHLEHYTMVAGHISFNLSSHQPIVLLRLSLPDDCRYFPEISANRHMVNIRMLALSSDQWELKKVTDSGTVSIYQCSMPNVLSEPH